MKKRIVLFLLGAILFISSLPMSATMAMEKIHTNQMLARYELHKISNRYPPPQSEFTYKNHKIKVEETIIDEGNYTDRWNYKIAFANLSVIVNEKRLDTLENYPIRVEDEGLAKYYGNISFIIVKDKEKVDEKLYIILKETKDIIENGIVLGTVPFDSLTYSLYSLDEAGSLESDSFTFTDRNALQTLLLTNSGTSTIAVGYYTDAWNWMPSIVFPFIFPFFSLLIGLILMIRYFPFKRQLKP